MSEPSHPENSKDPEDFEGPQAHISARVPEKVGRGVFSNGVLVLQGPHEFLLDFVQRIAKPYQVAARVILPPTVIPRLQAALSDNLKHYVSTFGPPPAIMTPTPPPKPPTLAEVYDDMKISDETTAGVFANGAMITHTQAEFCIDFIVNIFPRPDVSCRVFLAAPQITGFINSLSRAYQQ